MYYLSVISEQGRPRENADHLNPWEPAREDGYHDISAWQERLAVREREQKEGKAAYFVAYCGRPRELIATCSLTGISRGAFMACFMGYSIARSYQGKGYMKMLCQHATKYAFTELGLNRVMANYMPRNVRSEKLLKSMGFTKEGLAKNYLFINGRWEDHVLTSLLSE